LREGTPRTHVLRFLAVTTAVSLLLSALLMIANWKTSSPFWMGLTSAMLAMVPAWSMILASVGAPIGRKIRFALGLLVFVLAVDLLAFATGWQALAQSSNAADGTLEGVLIAAYRVVLVASPFVALVLFARKRPSVFWSAEER
jgi:hypothetical protein